LASRLGRIFFQGLAAEKKFGYPKNVFTKNTYIPIGMDLGHSVVSQTSPLYHYSLSAVKSLLGTHGQALTDYVKKMMRSSCHDGAANMAKAFSMMKVDYY